MDNPVPGPILDWLIKWLVRQFRRPVDRRRQLRAYLKKFVFAAENPENPGFLDMVFRRYRLRDDTYVEPTITPEDRPGPRQPASDYIIQLCTSQGPLYLLIHQMFGMGKTALVLRLSYLLARQYLSGANKTVPIYIPLRHFEGNSAKELAAFFDRYLSEYGLLAFDSLRDLLSRKDVLLILDGFDQMVTSSRYLEPVRVLSLIHDHLSGCRSKVILTMRSAYFQSNRELSLALNGHISDPDDQVPPREVPRFCHIFLNSLDDQQLISFLKQHPLSQRLDMDAFLRYFKSDVHLRSLISNPLLLNSILHSINELTGDQDNQMRQRYQDSDQRPLDIGDIYKRHTTSWINKDDLLSVLGLDINRKKHFVKDLAVSLLLSGQDALPLSEIHNIDGKSDWTSLNIETDKARYYDNQTRSFLLMNRDRTFMFTHRSFAEFFCSQALLDQLKSGQFDTGTVERLYSNLVIWFMRSEITEGDFGWLWKLLDSTDTYARRLAHALLPKAAKMEEDRNAVIMSFLRRFDKETDLEVKRHILYGIGWAGGNPCQPALIRYIEEHRDTWQAASVFYYHGVEQQREHCIARLESFCNEDHTYFNARGLYILDLELVGTPDCLPLIEPYTGDEEPDPIVRRIAARTVEAIKRRFGRS